MLQRTKIQECNLSSPIYLSIYESVDHIHPHKHTQKYSIYVCMYVSIYIYTFTHKNLPGINKGDVAIQAEFNTCILNVMECDGDDHLKTSSNKIMIC